MNKIVSFCCSTFICCKDCHPQRRFSADILFLYLALFCFVETYRCRQKVYRQATCKFNVLHKLLLLECNLHNLIKFEIMYNDQKAGKVFFFSQLKRSND